MEGITRKLLFVLRITEKLDGGEYFRNRFYLLANKYLYIEKCKKKSDESIEYQM
jgi:hypothetical protein